MTIIDQLVHSSSVTVTSSAYQLSNDSIRTAAIVLSAPSTNTGSLRIGGSDVTMSTGLELAPGDERTFSYLDLSAVYAIADGSQTLVYTWITATQINDKPVYCDTTDVLDLVPANINTDVIDTVFLVSAITRASAEVDSRVGSSFPLAYHDGIQKYPNIDDEPGTPEMIREAAAELAAYRVFVKLREINRGLGEDPQGIIHRNSGRKILEEIRTGLIDIILDGSVIGSRDLFGWSGSGSIPTFRRDTIDSSGNISDTGSFSNYNASKRWSRITPTTLR